MAVYLCTPAAAPDFPDYPTRRKIDTRVTKIVREHIVIYLDPAKKFQIWQWVKREAGKASACREQRFEVHQSGDALIQKLIQITFSLEDEPTIGETREKVKKAFDLEKVTKRFYDEFKKQHAAFLKFLKGIPDEHLQRWYASVMLNRLMFIYFVQKKCFLNANQDYLRDKLAESKKRGKNEFYSDFLCPLFFEGFAKRETDRSAKTKQLLGNIPYLNGGLFLKHQIELAHEKTIEIADAAFEKIFAFFDQYQWHLDDRPTREGNEINPDVLGYVFEKYINQKEMGAYYTKEDITGYISQSTIIPAVFDAARKRRKVAFEGEHTIWSLLQEEPDRYFYATVLHGIGKELPKGIAAGIKDVAKRGDWNMTAPEEYGLPTETWREVIARRQRYSEVRAKLVAGELQCINDLITYNLDIQRFAEEVISNSEDSELVWAFYKAVEKLSVLDPTCGSGAFLFAALNILEKLYDTCLVRMQAFVDDLDRSGERHSPKKLEHFRVKLAEMHDKTRHPSPRYFILKSIILNNLYGVDIMEQATEICKLRLFLKLVAQVNAGERIEPLPDIDFNIRAGNTLVGYASEPELDHALGGKFDFDKKLDQIKERASLTDLAYDRFRTMQVQYGFSAEDFSSAKNEVQNRLTSLRDELDESLSGEFGVKKGDRVNAAKWRVTHQPFHWFVEFYGLMKSGGFDVVIGNPPYAELRSVTNYQLRGYSTIATKNLYPLLMERSFSYTREHGRIGFIVPVSSISTEGYKTLQDILLRHPLYVSSYDDRPSRLFDGLEHIRLTIHLIENCANPAAEYHSTECLRWSAPERQHLFSRLRYERVRVDFLPCTVPKVSTNREATILKKLWADQITIGQQENKTEKWVVYYSRKLASFLQAVDFVPKVYDGKGKLRPPSELKELTFQSEEEALAIMCVLNSTLFRWFINVFSDFRHINKREVYGFPFNARRGGPEAWKEWLRLGRKLSKSLNENSELRQMTFAHDTLKVQCIIPKRSKAIIDEIDHALGIHYGLTDDETDFIINYDIKYRMGKEAAAAEDEEHNVEFAAAN
jgi:hypothetical protein